MELGVGVAGGAVGVGGKGVSVGGGVVARAKPCDGGDDPSPGVTPGWDSHAITKGITRGARVAARQLLIRFDARLQQLLISLTTKVYHDMPTVEQIYVNPIQVLRDPGLRLEFLTLD